MEAVSDKESDGSPEEDNEGKEKSQEKKKKFSKVRISFPYSCVFLRMTARASSREQPFLSQRYLLILTSRCVCSALAIHS